MNIPASNAPHAPTSSFSKLRVSDSIARASEASTEKAPVKANLLQHTERDREKALEKELSDANRRLAENGSEVRFEYDRQASRLIVRLIAIGTNEVLRQFPSDEALSAARLVKLGKPVICMQA